MEEEKPKIVIIGSGGLKGGKTIRAQLLAAGFDNVMFVSGISETNNPEPVLPSITEALSPRLYSRPAKYTVPSKRGAKNTPKKRKRKN